MRIPHLGWLVAFAGIGAAAIAYSVSCVNNTTVDTTCPTYCQNIQAACTGVNAQYPSTDNNVTCMNICGVMTPGTPGVGGADTVACRDMSVSNAKDDPPDSSQQYNDCVGGGVSAINCPADQCTSFCTVAVALCGDLNGYGDAGVGDCVSACQTWGQGFQGSLFDSTGPNTLECRTYHLELSQTGNPTDRATHCPHTGAVSARCNMPLDAGTDAATDAASDAATDASADVASGG